jgi:hypothetical protein
MMAGDRSQLREITQALFDIHTIEEAKKFFETYGPLHLDRRAMDRLSAKYLESTISWSDLVIFQGTMNYAWRHVHGSRDWMEFGARVQNICKFEIDFQEDRPRLIAVSHTALQAIFFDLLIGAFSGLPNAFCARPDCQKLFQKDTKHERKYCSAECAHLMSVRMYRQNKAKEPILRKAKSKKQVTITKKNDLNMRKYAKG